MNPPCGSIATQGTRSWTVFRCRNAGRRYPNRPRGLLRSWSATALRWPDCPSTAAPWQCQWESIPDGRAFYLLDTTGETLAYALMRRRYGRDGVARGATLYQAGTGQSTPDSPGLLRYLLGQSLAGMPHCIAMNIAGSQPATLAALAELGFRETVAQYAMRREMP